MERKSRRRKREENRRVKRSNAKKRSGIEKKIKPGRENN